MFAPRQRKLTTKTRSVDNAAVPLFPRAAARRDARDLVDEPGRELDKPTQEYFSSRFGHDFSSVRVHTDERAAASHPGRHRGTGCPCGGGCARCAAQHASVDRDEREADGRADIIAGRPIAAGAHTLREPRFGHDFSRVPVHTDVRAARAGLPSADFSQVRVHPSAPEVTGPLGARAVTLGQHIYFHPGEFHPGTSAGDALIDHELAHTLQTRGQPEISAARSVLSVPAPDDAIEKNADSLARGESTQVLAATAGTALRSPFDSESPADKARRRRLIQSIDGAIKNLLRLLSTGGLIRLTEIAAERKGVRGVILGGTSGRDNEIFNSYSDRDKRLRRVIRSLAAMAMFYRGATVPTDFAAPTQNPDGGFSAKAPSPAPGQQGTIFLAFTAEQVDLNVAYQRYRIAQGQLGPEFDNDRFYIRESMQIVPGAAIGAPRVSKGVPSGAYIVVPDVENEPLRYRLVDGYPSAPPGPGAFIRELWHDEIGYYYTYYDKRIYVRSPWSR